MKHILYLFPLALMACQPNKDLRSDLQDSNEPLSQESHQGTVLCHNLVFAEPKFSFAESDVTAARATRAIAFLQDELPSRMETKYQSLKEQPGRDDGLMEGEIAISYYNGLAILKLYRLKLEALSASPSDKDRATALFCTVLSQTIAGD